jgi:hypothetical protein
MWHDNRKTVKNSPDLHPSLATALGPQGGIVSLAPRGNRARREKARCAEPRAYCWGWVPPLGTLWGPTAAPSRLSAARAGEMAGAEGAIGRLPIKHTAFRLGEEAATARSADVRSRPEIGLPFSHWRKCRPRIEGRLGLVND